MKKIVIFLSSLILTAGIASAYPSTYDEGVLLRAGPSEVDEVKIDLPRNYPLRILKRNGSWALVTDWLNCRGWVESNLITGESTGVVRRSNVTLRSGPGTRYSRRSKLYQGTIVKLLGKKGVWYKILVIDGPEQIEGWLHGKFLWG
ncbi:MAG: SH3 domain-containing protein [Candidatus Margulisbacteria bacterium]|nr:SH3 domain-containing protein [Candidatus Margulisiibacteriota bacterium]MBU1617505.1 SH3 domain-containing protein [Candidatus Margulisiibacteriota bacterium]MBU1867248.1 SH3 domain-containing protein [Candidatus Margulisiibacteriota bacterium]